MAQILILVPIILSALVPPLLDGGTTHLPVSLLRFLLIIALTVFLITCIRKKEFTWFATGLYSPFIFLIIICLLSLVISKYRYMSFQWTVSIASYLLAFFLVVNVLDRRSCRVLLILLIFSGLIHAFWALYQYLGTGVSRATGGFFNPSRLAGYLVPTFSFLFTYCIGNIRGLFSRDIQVKKFGLVVLIVLVVFAGVIVTKSRGGMLVIAAISIVTVWYFFRSKAVYLILLGLCFFLLPNPIQERLKKSEKDPYAHARIEIWKNSFEMLADNPFGVGLGMYKYYSPQYEYKIETGLARYMKSASTAHNEYLHFACELGIFGIGIISWILFIVIRQALIPFRRRTYGGKTIQKYLNDKKGISLALLAIFLHAGVDSVFHNPSIAMEFAIFLGILFKGEGGEKRIQSSRINGRYYVYVLCAAGIVLLMVLRPFLANQEIREAFKAGEKRELEKRIEHGERATLICWGISSAHRSLASSYFAKYDKTRDIIWLERTIKELETAIELNVMDDLNYSRLGYVYGVLALDHKDKYLMEKAVEYYRNVVALRPFYAFSYKNIGSLYLEFGSFFEAEDYLQKAVEIEPNYLSALFLRGLIWEKNGELQKARREYLKVINLFTKFKFYSTKNDYEKALLEVNIDSVNARLDLLEKRLRS